jgi:thioredoxin 1
MEPGTKARTFSEIIRTEKLVLVDFSALWCGPCKMMKPVLKELKSWIGNEATILEVDVDKNVQAATKYQITSLPTFLLFRNGLIVWKHSGIADLGTLKKIFQQNFSL